MALNRTSCFKMQKHGQQKSYGGDQNRQQGALSDLKAVGPMI